VGRRLGRGLLRHELQLRELHELRGRGLITPAQYDEKRAEIFGDI
jgi:hypothetical protein